MVLTGWLYLNIWSPVGSVIWGVCEGIIMWSGGLMSLEVGLWWYSPDSGSSLAFYLLIHQDKETPCASYITPVIQYEPNQLGQERIYLAYISWPLSITEGSQDRHSTKTELWKQKLNQRPWRLDHLLMYVWHWIQWPGPSLTSHLSWKWPRICLWANLIEVFFSVAVLYLFLED